MTERIVVIGGPWPGRLGCVGVIVDDPGDGIYPFDKPTPGEVVVLLDDDPVTRGPQGPFGKSPEERRRWTCRLDRSCVSVWP